MAKVFLEVSFAKGLLWKIPLAMVTLEASLTKVALEVSLTKVALDLRLKNMMAMFLTSVRLKPKMKTETTTPICISVMVEEKSHTSIDRVGQVTPSQVRFSLLHVMTLHIMMLRQNNV